MSLSTTVRSKNSSISHKPSVVISDPKKPYYIALGVLMSVAAIPMSLSAFFAGGLLVSNTGFFNSPQNPWEQAYFYIFGIVILYAGVYRMFRGRFWNALGLFVTPPLLMLLTIDYSSTFSETPDAIPWLICLYFVVTWFLLLIYRARIAFVVFWPLAVITKALQDRSDIVYLSSDSTYYLICLGALPALLAVIFGPFFIRNWRLLAAALALCFMVAYYFLSSAQFYTVTFPTALNEDKKVQIKGGSISYKDVDGVTFTLIEHRHNFDFTDKSLPDPQPFYDGVLVPYRQLGNSCDNWVAIRPESNQVFWAIYAESSGDCGKPSVIKVSPDDDIVAFATYGNFYINRISTGKNLYSMKIHVDMIPVVKDKLVYFIGRSDLSTGRPYEVYAWNIETHQIVWSSTINQNIKTLDMENGLNIFAHVEKKQGFPSSGLLVDGADPYTLARLQWLIDESTGKVNQIINPVKIKLPLDQKGNYYIPEDDMGKNIMVAKNASLAKPITKLHIKGRLVSLPEGCLTFPVESQGSVFCITDSSVLSFKL